MARFERQRTVDQRDRDRVLKIHVRHCPVVDDARPILRKPDDDSLDVVHSEIVLEAERQERVQGCLDRIAHGKNLDGGFGDEKTAA